MTDSNIGRGSGSVHSKAPDSTPGYAPATAISTALRWNTVLAVNFLQQLIGSGRLAVAALDPRADRCEGATFSLPEDVTALSAWIEMRQGAHNLYYTLNELVPREQQRGAAGRRVEAARPICQNLPRAQVRTQTTSGSRRARRDRGNGSGDAR